MTTFLSLDCTWFCVYYVLWAAVLLVTLNGGEEQEVANRKLASGVSHVYNLALATKLRRSVAQHGAIFRGAGWDLEAAASGWTIEDYDDAITIHVHGWCCLSAIHSSPPMHLLHGPHQAHEAQPLGLHQLWLKPTFGRFQQ